MDGFHDEDGCPDPDNDGDGTLDARDDCPAEPGEPTLNGCPDGDGDAVPDHRDGCPGTAGKPELEGCNLVQRSEGGIELLDMVRFRRNSAQLRQDSNALLDELADILIARNEPGEVQIAVYMTVRKTNRANQRLAQERADAIEEHLVAKGGAPDRLAVSSQIEEDPRSRRDATRTICACSSSTETPGQAGRPARSDQTQRPAPGGALWTPRVWRAPCPRAMLAGSEISSESASVP